MGLDFVELIMQLEDEFAVSISDEVAATLTTVGATVDYIVDELRRRAPVCPSAQSFYRLRESLVARCGARRNEVRLDAPMGRLARKRRREWPAIASHAWLRETPFPPEEMSVGELIRTHRVSNHWRADGSLDEPAVERRVMELVAETAAVPVEELSRESHYFNELRIS